MKLTLALSLTLLLSGTAVLGTSKQKHPFLDDEMAAYFGTRVINSGYIHHEEQRCNQDAVRFEIEVELPFPTPPKNRTFSVTGPECAHERKKIIEKELAKFPRSAFKKVKRKKVFNFSLTANFFSK